MVTINQANQPQAASSFDPSPNPEPIANLVFDTYPAMSHMTLLAPKAPLPPPKTPQMALDVPFEALTNDITN
jgi:hypothetical protein